MAKYRNDRVDVIITLKITLGFFFEEVKLRDVRGDISLIAVVFRYFQLVSHHFAAILLLKENNICDTLLKLFIMFIFSKPYCFQYCLCEFNHLSGTSSLCRCLGSSFLYCLPASGSDGIICYLLCVVRLSAMY